MCDRYAAGAAVAPTDTDFGRGEVQWQIALGIVLAQAAVPTLEREGQRGRERDRKTPSLICMVLTPGHHM